MEPERITTSALLEQWREASRAADLAERLSVMAEEAAERADRNAQSSQEIAVMAERAARAAERAAQSARRAADRASAFARAHRTGGVADATETARHLRADEATARDQYHDAERVVRERQDR